MEDGDIGYKTQKFLSQVSLILEGQRKSTFFSFFFSYSSDLQKRKASFLRHCRIPDWGRRVEGKKRLSGKFLKNVQFIHQKSPATSVQ